MSDDDKAFYRSAFIGALSLVLFDALFAPVMAQLISLPDTARARAIVQRHMDAVGGEKALTMKHTHMVMTMSMSGSPAVVRQEDWRSLPRFYSRMTIPGVGTTEIGSDGTVSWMISPQLGPMILKKSPIDSVTSLNPQKMLTGKSMTYLGVLEMAGKSNDAVRFLLPDSTHNTAYFDPATGLMAGMNFEKTPGPPGQMAMSFDDWKRFGAILYATRMTMRLADGKEMVMRVLTVSTAPIDLKVFELPEKVREHQTRRAPQNPADSQAGTASIETYLSSVYRPKHAAAIQRVPDTNPPD